MALHYKFWFHRGSRLLFQHSKKPQEAAARSQASIKSNKVIPSFQGAVLCPHAPDLLRQTLLKTMAQVATEGEAEAEIGGG